MNQNPLCNNSPDLLQIFCYFMFHSKVIFKGIIFDYKAIFKEYSKHGMVDLLGLKKLFVSCNPTLTNFNSKKSLPQSFFRPPNS